MFELAILYTILDMATSNLNEIRIYNKKKKKTKTTVAIALKKNLFN